MGVWAEAVAVEGEAFMWDAYVEEEGEMEVSITRPEFGWWGCPEMGLGGGAGMRAVAKGSLVAMRSTSRGKCPADHSWNTHVGLGERAEPDLGTL